MPTKAQMDELHGLCLDRARMQMQLAPLLRLIGPSADDRQRQLRDRRARAKKLRLDLRANAELIAVWGMIVTGEQA